MGEHEINAYCQEKLRQFDEFKKSHEADSPKWKEKITIAEASLGYLVKALDAYKNSDLTIKMSLLGIVFAILCQIGGFIYLWGQLTQTVEITAQRVQVLEEMHPRSK